MKSYNLKNFALKISPKYKIVGLRQGEKLNEILISESEKKLAEEKKDMWIIKQY
jgi:FlaA1/EpsC-like NDP-sugar epimerase